MSSVSKHRAGQGRGLGSGQSRGSSPLLEKASCSGQGRGSVHAGRVPGSGQGRGSPPAPGRVPGSGQCRGSPPVPGRVSGSGQGKGSPPVPGRGLVPGHGKGTGTGRGQVSESGHVRGSPPAPGRGSVPGHSKGTGSGRGQVSESGHGRGSGLCGIQVSKVEQDIDNFLENFRRKSSTLDEPLSDVRRETLGLPPIPYTCSSSQCSTDDCNDDSPDRSYYLGGGDALVKTHKRQVSNTTTDSEWGPDYDELEDPNIKDKLQGNTSGNESTKKEDLADDSDVMGEVDCPYSVLDVAPILQSKYVLISGGKAKNGAVVLTFPENPNQPEISDTDYKKVITYLCCVPRRSETEIGFVIVIDRRQASWGDVKAILQRISGFFPHHVQVVFLLQPKSFFQRAFADMRSKFVKEELEFKVVMCNEPKEMFDYIDPDQLTKDVGGELEYDSTEWTQHKSAVEKFCSNTEKIATSIKILLKKYEEVEIPNDVPGMEKLIQDHQQGKREILDDLESAVTHGQTLMSCITADNTEVPLVHQTHVYNLQRLLAKLGETKNDFEEFWKKHELRLDQSLQLRKFEDEFKVYQYNIERKLEWLETSMNEVGETIQKVEELFESFEEFEKEAMRDLDQAEVMRNTGDQMIAEDNYAVDSIRPKCIELQRMCDQYKSLLRRRREILNKSHDLQDRIDKANKWCNHGVDMLSEMQTAKCNTIEESRKALQDIEEFMATSSQLRLNNPKEFRQLFETMITPETRQVVQKVLRKMEDVHGMCERQRQSLQSTITSGRPTSSRPGPVRAVHPNTRTTNDTEQKRKAGQEPSHKPHSVYEKSARLRTDGQQPGTKSRPYITYPTTGSVSNMSDPGSEKTRNSVSSMSTSTSVGSSNSDSETLLAKRRHVLNELIETEKTYVSQLSDILNGYYSKMEERSMQHLIPEELKGKRDILFGNLEQIYKFHNDTFLQELENCQDMPAKVGACFANRKEEFHLYSLYCQNKKRSEALRNQIGDQNPFFMECQRRLGHKLPLGAYLLKPVQRITKYQLLLKEMLRFSDDNQESEVQLREALNCMLEVVRYVNDSMHQVSIVGFPGNVADLGRILMQGSFTVSTEHTKGKIKDLRFKPMHRHVFLYEKVILLCKRKDEASNSDQGVYAFKNCLKLSQVGLTENVKGDRKKFELWLRGREEVYILLAPSLPSKEMWVKEIKRVLMNQFDQLKVHHRNVHGMSQEDLFNLTSSSNNSSRYVDNWKTHNVMIFNNNTPTVPQGLEMMSPESPPHGNQNQEAWSSDEYSDGEGEKVKQSSQQHYSSHPKSQPHHMQQFASLGNYTAEDNTELSLREGDIVRVLRSGSTGWWYVHHTGTGQEGWVPSTYLQPIRNGQSHTPISDYSSSSQDLNSKSSLTSIYSSNTSPVDETTI